MQNNNSFNGSAIINSWSFLAFGLSHGNLNIAPCKDSNGKPYNMLAFEQPATGYITWVSFSDKVRGMTAEDICREFENLQVIELEPTQEVLEARKAAGRQLQSYMLCRKGEGGFQKVNINFEALAGLK